MNKEGKEAESRNARSEERQKETRIRGQEVID